MWLIERAPSAIERITTLDPGEEAAISLARELRAELVLLDDGDARRAAAARGLAVIGLLGILEWADERGLLNLPEVAARLPADYRIDRALLDAVVERCARRRNAPS